MKSHICTKGKFCNELEGQIKGALTSNPIIKLKKNKIVTKSAKHNEIIHSRIKIFFDISILLGIHSLELNCISVLLNDK